MHLASLLFPFKEIIRTQNLFKIWFYIPLESHYMANLDLLRIKQISGYYVAHYGL